MDIKKIEDLLANLEKARRDKNYDLMWELAEQVDNEVRQEDSAPAWKVKAREYYELHMAYYQQAIDQKSPRLLDRSLQTAIASQKHAMRAGDKAGGLYIRMNISGLIMPAQGEVERAIRMSEEVDAEAEALARGVADPPEKHRVGRISVNTRLHRIKMHTEHTDDMVAIRQLIASVEHHPDYISENNQGWRDAIKQAYEYLEAH
jgi:hypothetical protein